ncbi:MAG: peptidoglycan-binding protein [Alphaproteobacteria bacterium]|nr:peptidoglycan-binding protein [Alphaproteobacteria bacterium]
MAVAFRRAPSPTPEASTPTRAPVAPEVTAPAQAASSGADLSRVQSGSETPMLDGVSGEKKAEKQGVVLSSKMKLGTEGEDVSKLQEHLGVKADGKFGDDTREALAAWQQQNGLEPDGVVGPDTLDALAVGAKGVDLDRTLRTGARGRDVERLQRFLGLPVDGKFGPDTRAAVIQFQMDHGLDPDGIIGKKSREAFSGVDAKEAEKAGKASKPQGAQTVEAPQPVEVPLPQRRPERPQTVEQPKSEQPAKTETVNAPKGELRSRWHDDSKFVPKYASTAISESGIYRGKNDPYAVGAISKPTRKQDLGGKTYGVYQFESSVYRDGSTRGKKAVQGSTVMRFVNWEGNPYSKELKDVVKKHGVASKEFDAAWLELAHGQNKDFGEAQQKFMEKENNDRVNGFMDKIGASEAARKDPRLQDLVIGTYNQYSGITKSIASYVAAKNKGGKMSADEIGKLVQDYKRARVGSHFRSSPKAHKGIYSRIAREKAMFK